MTHKIKQTITIDGNQAAAEIAHLCNEVIAIYPITPASPMGEWSDEWSSQGRKNLWGTIPEVIEMQSEGGAAGALHGALQTGALTTTFTASQGLLLMLPNMYKIAGELTPTVFHIAARSLACQALSIFGDHSDVMSARMTGFAMLSSNSPQEVMDFALIAQAASLQSRIPALHFFDGFRTSHELAKLETIDHDIITQMINNDLINAHRANALSPAQPVLRGSSQNPDVYFQARESVNPYYQKMPGIMQQTMDHFAQLSDRQYHLFDYIGATDAQKIIILMGSSAETVHETVDYLQTQNEKVGVIKVRLYRPLDSAALLQAIPQSVKAIAVLDRTKEPGSDGEPLYKDVVTTIAMQLNDEQARFKTMPTIVGGRYGLSSKEFTPAMVKAIFDMLTEQPKNHFTIGIHDDISHSSLAWDKNFRTNANNNAFQALFYGLGSDGTVSANKNTIKIIGAYTDLYAQGYFVYDSKKSGATTVSHLRFGPDKIRSSYLIGDNDADFIACHQSIFLQRYNMLDKAADNSVFLLNSTLTKEQVWETLPARMQQQCIDKKIRFYTIDAYAVAQQTGMGKRINTIMQTCFFAISGILPQQEAIQSIKDAVQKTYGKKGKRIVEMNYKAIDKTLKELQQIEIPQKAESQFEISPAVANDAPDFVQQVTAKIIAGKGDDLPVSAFTADGTFPTGTAAYEKRSIAIQIPVWDNSLCTQCGKCPLVCPHAAIRSKIYHKDELKNAPENFKSMPMIGKKAFPEGYHITYQVAPEDCTGCGLCVDICPIHDKSNASRKALNMQPIDNLLTQEKHNWQFYQQLSIYDRRELKTATIKGAMVLEPLFEFSGACVGCGETPYIKLASQLFGDRMLVANATGCSSIYGGNLPTTPWTKNNEGRGPAWNNSLFEDNAEFGLGMRVSVDKHKQQAQELLKNLATELNEDLLNNILNADESTESGITAQRQRVAELRKALQTIDSQEAKLLNELSEYLCKHSVWIIGGDGWAYDIGYGGLDHVLASGRNVNILVLDTEVYSNTGGQTSKATPRGAVAKFSSAGKASAKKDLALLAMEYENVYIANVAYGAKDIQTLRAFHEAEAHDGPSLIIAYSPCIAHGVDLSNNHRQQKLAVDSGHWPLFRFDPEKGKLGKNPLHMDSKAPSIPYKDYIMTEPRFNMLWHSHPENAEKFLRQSQHEVQQRYNFYKQLSEIQWDEQTTLKSARSDLSKKEVK